MEIETKKIIRETGEWRDEGEGLAPSHVHIVVVKEALSFQEEVK